ncbi:hypothetical protein D3C74_443330 [compost metagenome]
MDAKVCEGVRFWQAEALAETEPCCAGAALAGATENTAPAASATATVDRAMRRETGEMFMASTLRMAKTAHISHLAAFLGLMDYR